ncbi:hypothetical protein N3K66_000282 [Trichothecium roseum]|uniref:Uncharacterized protein n=1 Tax=Trichothecium roseum TaxID=47278 RepID=A0ACC0VDA8_9HYPO|nr:hypothetical protein N3K66_000282 [Trichothecium roseum]
MKHGVRVVATFALQKLPKSKASRGATRNPACQHVMVFYTIPPDMFHDISRVGILASASKGRPVEGPKEWSSEWLSWRDEGEYSGVDIFSDPFGVESAYPLRISGQVVATCTNLVEVALDSSPEMVIWAFSTDGWARSWAIKASTGEGNITRSVVQRDGSLRHVDDEGDVVMVDDDEDG